MDATRGRSRGGVPPRAVGGRRCSNGRTRRTRLLRVCPRAFGRLLRRSRRLPRRAPRLPRFRPAERTRFGRSDGFSYRSRPAAARSPTGAERGSRTTPTRAGSASPSPSRTRLGRRRATKRGPRCTGSSASDGGSRCVTAARGGACSRSGRTTRGGSWPAALRVVAHSLFVAQGRFAARRGRGNRCPGHGHPSAWRHLHFDDGNPGHPAPARRRLFARSGTSRAEFPRSSGSSSSRRPRGRSRTPRT